MLVLFVRTILVYLLVFIVIRLTGKRQLSELSPFDLVITLLIADLASEPVSDIELPLFCGVVPILTLFLMQKLLSFLSLKNESIRKLLCGRPLIIIEDGHVNESVMRQASYTVQDLTEQLRKKEVFNISDVAYAILETDGDLSILVKGRYSTPTYEDMKLEPPEAAPSYEIIIDGKFVNEATPVIPKPEIIKKLATQGIKSEKEVLFAMLCADGVLHVQEKEKCGGAAHYIKMNKNTRRTK